MNKGKDDISDGGPILNGWGWGKKDSGRIGQNNGGAWECERKIDIVDKKPPW